MLAELLNRRSYETDWAGGFPVFENDLQPVRDVLLEFLAGGKKGTGKLLTAKLLGLNNFTYRSVPVDFGEDGKGELYVFSKSIKPESSPIGLSIQNKKTFQVDNLTRGAIYFPAMEFFRYHFKDMNLQFELQRNLSLINQDVIKLLKVDK